MASIQAQIELYDSMSAPLEHITNSLHNSIYAVEEMQSSFNTAFSSASFSGVEASIDATNAALDDMTQNITANANRQQDFTDSVNETSHAADGLGKKIIGMVAAYASIKSIGQVLDLSDAMAQTDARLSLIVDDGGSVEGLRQQILQVAESTRAPFMETADMVAKMGMQASAAFQSNNELLAFAEQLNKSFVIAGTSAQGIDSVMLQMTQAMAAGRLQGEELAAVMDNAAPIVQNIQRYLEEVQGIDASNIKQLASDGIITAEVMKNALFYAADEVNAKFEQMPVTFGQAWTGIQSDLLMTFQPMLQMIGAGAGWIHENWAVIEPVFWGLAAAVGAYTLATTIQTAATWLSVAANRALIVTMLSNPILWIAVLIGALVAVIYNWIQSVGGIKVAWMICMDAIKTAWDWTCIGLMTGIYWVMDLWNKFQLCFATVSTNIQNFMGDMKAGTLMILQNMVNGAIDIINGFIGMLNNIPGVSIDTIAQVSFGTMAQLENEAAKAARAAELQSYEDQINAQILGRENSLNQMKADAIYASAARQVEISAVKTAATTANSQQTDPFGDTASMMTDISSIADNTSDLARSVDISQEDLKHLRDLAEQKTINNYTEVKLEMTNNNNINSNMDLDGVVDYLGTGVNEAMEKAAEGVHQ